jgi:hypothetical protein
MRPDRLRVPSGNGTEHHKNPERFQHAYRFFRSHNAKKANPRNQQLIGQARWTLIILEQPRELA